MDSPERLPLALQERPSQFQVMMNDSIDGSGESNGRSYTTISLYSEIPILIKKIYHSLSLNTPPLQLKKINIQADHVLTVLTLMKKNGLEKSVEAISNFILNELRQYSISKTKRCAQEAKRTIPSFHQILEFTLKASCQKKDDGTLIEKIQSFVFENYLVDLVFDTNCSKKLLGVLFSIVDSSDKEKVKNYKDVYMRYDDMMEVQLKWKRDAQLQLQTNHSIIWLVYVYSDGWGDLFSCLNAFRVTQVKYPDWDMKIIIRLAVECIPFSLTEYGVNSENCLIVSSIDKHLWTKRINGQHNELTIHNSSSIENKINDFIDFFEKSDLQICVSTQLNMGDIKINPNSFLFFEEYGRTFSEGNRFSMGLNPQQCGIFVLNPKIPKAFSHPFLADIFNRYEKVYVNYGPKIESYALLVDSLNPHSNEIIILTNVAQLKINLDHFNDNFTIIYDDHQENETCLYRSKNSEKILRLINVFPIEHGDMLLAYDLAHEPIGINGNITFSETLDKLPFYNARIMTRFFWEELVILASQATKKNVELIDYLKQLSYEEGKDNNTVFRKIIIDPKDLPLLKAQWAELVEIIREDWDVENALFGVINRRLLEKRESELYPTNF